MHAARPARLNPFPGLRPFTTEEDYLFFGREEQTNELLGLLREHRFLAVVGTSGSGKSSLVRAGLLPALHGGTMAKAGSSWEVLVLRPGGDPIANLANALVDADLYDRDDTESLPRIVATLNRSRLGLVEAVRQSDLPDGTNLLVVVDQFEELFRFRQAGLAHQEAASAFVKLLLAAARETEQPIYIAITMRSDYLGECSHIAGLAEAVNDGEYLIPRLSRDQRRAAIEKPVSVGGGAISHRLVQKLLNDVGDDADHLPVLQHALMRIFDYWAEDHADGEAMDLRHYERAGGLQEALSRHSDEVYDALPTDRLRGVAERVFKALTERGSDNRGIRRPTRMEKLCAITGAEYAEVAAVVEAFRQSGRTFLMPMSEVELTPQTVIDISHESLMRVWNRLDRWVEEESQSARIYRRLADTAALHAEGKAGIYRDPDLQIALSWRETEQPNEAWAARYHADFDLAIAFLEKSRDDQHAENQRIEAARQRELEQAKKLAATERLRAQEQKRAANRMKWLSGGAAIIAAFALVAFGLALIARQEAKQSELEAKRNALLAQRNELEAQKNAELADASAIEAKENADRTRQSAAAAEISAKEALRQQGLALQQQQVAEANFRKALRTVDEYFVSVSESRLLKVPGLQPLRKELLQSALSYYEGFVQQHGADPTLQKDLAEAYTRVARITSEIGDKTKALETLAKARVLRESLLARDPKDRKRKLELVMHDQIVGNIQRELGDADVALKSLEQAHKQLLAISPQSGKTTSLNLLNSNIGGVSQYDSDDPNILNAFASILNDRAAAHVAANEPHLALQDFYSAIYIRRNLVSESSKVGAALLNERGQLTPTSKMDARGTRSATHTFSMIAGQGYTIDLESPEFDTFLIVRDPAGRLVAQDDDGGDGTNSRLSFRPTRSGVHTLVATSFLKGQIGSYTLTVRGESQDKLVHEHVSQLTANDTKDEFGRSYRSHDVKLEANRNYVITASSPGAEFDPILVVWDGNKIATQGNARGNVAGARAIFTPTHAGVFRLNVASLVKGQTGAYRLVVSEFNDKGLELDVNGRLTREDPIDKSGARFKVHEIKLQAGDRYTIDLVCPDRSIDPLLRIKDADGKWVAEDDDSGGGLNARLMYRPTNSGTFQIVATTFGPNSLGAFRLKVRHDVMDAKQVLREYQLAQQWLKLGELIRTLGMFELAMPHLVEAQTIFLSLVSGYPGHDLASEFERDLATTYESMGDLRRRENDLAKSLQAYRKAVELRQKLVQLNPAVTEFQADLARSYSALAGVHAAMDQTSEAVAAYRQATTHQLIAFTTDPNIRTYAHTLGRYHAALGRIQKGLGESEDALVNLRLAQKYLEKPAPTNASEWFDLALVQAACSELDSNKHQQLADASMQALRNAAVAGFDDVESLSASKEFDPLRTRSDFQTFMTEIKAGSRKLVWLEDFAVAKAQAAKEGKDIFVHFGGADWAAFDVAFRNRVYTQPIFIEFASKNFVMLKVEQYRYRQPPKLALGSRLALSSKWSISSVPTIVLTDAHGRGYAKQVGASRADALGFVRYLKSLRASRERRDQDLKDAESATGTQKAILLDRALKEIPADFAREYTSLSAKVERDILKSDPENRAALRDKYLDRVKSRADSILRGQHWLEAIRELSVLVEQQNLEPKVVQSLRLERGRAYGQLGRWDEARVDFEKAFSLEPPPQPAAWRQFASLLLQMGDVGACRDICTRMFDRFHTLDAAAKLEIALACLQDPASKVPTDRLVKIAQEVVSAPLDSEFVHFTLAVAYYRASDFKQARNAVEESRKRHPDWNAQPLNDILLAMIEHRLGNVEKSRELLAAVSKWRQEQLKNTAEGWSHEIDSWWDRVAVELFRSEAEVLINESRDSTDNDDLLGFARAYGRRGDREKSLTLINQLVDRQPENVKFLLERSQLCAELKQPEKAAADIETAMKVEERAVAAKRETLRKNPSSVEARDAAAQTLRELAATQHRIGRPADAAATLAELADLWPDDWVKIHEVARQITALVPAAGKDLRQRVTDLALKTLKRAVDAGNLDADALGRDSRFEPLRANLGFQSLLSEMHVRSRFATASDVVREFKEHTGAVEAVVVTPDGRRAISAGYDGHLRVWEVPTGKQIRAIKVGSGSSVSGLALTKDGRKVFAGCHDKLVRLYDVVTGEELRQFQGHADTVWTVALSSDGRQILSTSEDKSVRLWEVETGKEIRRFPHEAAVWAVAFSADGLLMATGDKAQTVRIWDISSGTELQRWNTQKEIGQLKGLDALTWCVSFTPDGNQIVAGGADGFLRFWDVKSGRRIRTLAGHENWVRCIGFMEDSRQMITGDSSGNLIVWDLQTGAELSRMKAPGGRVGLAFVPGNGSTLTADSDNSVRLWLVSPAVSRARGHARLNQFVAAEAEYAKAINRNPGDNELRIERARLFGRLGKWRQAVDDLGLALKTHAESWQLWADRGRCWAMLGDEGKATDDFAKALDLLPPDPFGHSTRSVFLREIAGWENVFRNLLDRRASDSELKLALARRLASLRQWDQAIAEYEKLAPSAALDVVFEQACARILIGDIDGYRKVVQLAMDGNRDNQDPWVRHILARLSSLSPEDATTREQAIVWGEQSVAGAATAWHFHSLAMARYRAGQFSQAVEAFKRSETLNWGNASIVNQLGLALASHDAGDPDQARLWFDKATGRLQSMISPTPNHAVDLHPVDWMEIELLRREAESVLNAPNRREAQLAVRQGKWGEAIEHLDLLIKANPRSWSDRLSRARCIAASKRAAESILHYERLLASAATAERDILTREFAECLLASRWTVLNPSSAKSESGATLTVLPDGSVKASGVNPDTDVYVLEAQANGPIAAIRLEAIPNPDMPQGGSGRPGNFILSDFRVTSGEGVVKWKKATADFSQHFPADFKQHHPVELAIDGDPSTGWAVWPRQTEPHWAVFTPENPFGQEKTRLTIRLAFQNRFWPKHALGYFRLSVSARADDLQQAKWFPAASTPRARLGAAFLASGDPKRAAAFLSADAPAGQKSHPADWLVLVLAHITLKEADHAKTACAKATDLLKSTGASESLRPLIRDVALALGQESSEAKHLIEAANIGPPPTTLNDAIRQNPDQAAGFRNRGGWYAERGRWQEASNDLETAFRLEPDAFTGMRLGMLFAETGDTLRYRNHCRAMLERWGATDRNYEADQTLKTVLLRPEHEAEPKQLARLAEVAVSGDKDGDWFEWYLVAKAIHDYRTDKFADALAASREIRRRAPRTKGDSKALASIAWTIEAMALRQTKNDSGAAVALNEANKLLAAHLTGFDGGPSWHDWMAARLLYREALARISHRP